MTTSAAVFRAIARSRKSCARFEPKRVIPAETLQDVLESTLRAPSSFNLQPTQIVMVQDEAVKEQLADQAMLGVGNQYKARDCSALAVFLADMEATRARLQRIVQLERDWIHQQQQQQSSVSSNNTRKSDQSSTYLSTLPVTASFLIGHQGGQAATLAKQAAAHLLSKVTPMPNMEDAALWSCKNTALAVQSYVLAATSHGLATCIMEGYDARRLTQVLRVPEARYAVPMVVATGYEYHDPEHQLTENEGEEPAVTSPRLSLEEVVFQDSFGQLMYLNSAATVADEEEIGNERESDH